MDRGTPTHAPRASATTRRNVPRRPWQLVDVGDGEVLGGGDGESVGVGVVVRAALGPSKSGAELNESAPAVVIANKAASVPLRVDPVTASPETGSVAATVPTAVVFSARLEVASDVSVGASLASLAVTVRSWVAVRVPPSAPPVAVPL